MDKGPHYYINVIQVNIFLPNYSKVFLTVIAIDMRYLIYIIY